MCIPPENKTICRAKSLPKPSGTIYTYMNDGLRWGWSIQECCQWNGWFVIFTFTGKLSLDYCNFRGAWSIDIDISGDFVLPWLPESFYCAFISNCVTWLHFHSFSSPPLCVPHSANSSFYPQDKWMADTRMHYACPGLIHQKTNRATHTCHFTYVPARTRTHARARTQTYKTSWRFIYASNSIYICHRIKTNTIKCVIFLHGWLMQLPCSIWPVAFSI